MAVIRQQHEQAVRTRYRQAAIVYLVLGLAVMGLARLPGMENIMPTPFLSEWRVPVAVFAMFIATALIYGAHRKITFLVSLFALYRMVVMGLNAVASKHVELRPDPNVVVPESWADPEALQALVETEVNSGSPLYELTSFEPGMAGLPPALAEPLSNPAFETTWVLWICVGLLAIVVLTLWRAARHTI